MKLMTSLSALLVLTGLSMAASTAQADLVDGLYKSIYASGRTFVVSNRGAIARYQNYDFGTVTDGSYTSSFFSGHWTFTMVNYGANCYVVSWEGHPNEDIVCDQSRIVPMPPRGEIRSGTYSSPTGRMMTIENFGYGNYTGAYAYNGTRYTAGSFYYNGVVGTAFRSGYWDFRVSKIGGRRGANCIQISWDASADILCQ